MKNVFILLFLFCILITACDKDTANTITVSYWQYFHQTKVEIIDELIMEFEKLNPGIKVEHVHFPYESYNQKVAATAASGTGPDVINLFYGWLPLYIKEGYLQPLPQPEFDSNYFEDNFFPFVRKGVLFNEKYFAVPVAVSTRGLFWNKKLFREAGLDPDSPPKTLDELLNFAKILSKYDKQGNLILSGLGLMPSNQGHSWIREALIRQFGATPYSDDNKRVTYNTPQGIEALKWYTDRIIIDNVGAPGFISDDVAGFRNQLIAMHIDGSQRVAIFNNIEGLEWGVTELPAHNGVKSNYASFWANSISAGVQGDKLDASIKFIKFLASADVQVKWLEKVGELPASPQTAMLFINLPNVGEFLKGLEYAHTTVFADETAQREIFMNMVDRVVLDKITPAAAIREAEEKEQKLLDNFWN